MNNENNIVTLPTNKPAEEKPMGTMVWLHNKNAVTDSLLVAEFFGMEHKNVLQAIRNIDCSDEFRRLNFQPSSYVNEQGKSQPMIEMPKNGFIFLAMGFTGAKAAAIKEAYIGEFDRMEKLPTAFYKVAHFKGTGAVKATFIQLY